ncbi:CD2-associated protein isoform X2 [Dendropsophus ebraccatus]|uniref:CD2-associated protein isoform X2 n=1 Tax=Dendropsophus ebraccatus TaxID=150705 RepID=UPI0038322E5E
MVEYVVEYDYEAVHEDELTMRVGDIIKNVKRLDEEGWMEGELNGKRGAFPDNFVKEVKKDAEPKEENLHKREKSGNVASLVQRMSVIGIPGMGPPPPPPNKSLKKKSKKRQCKVVFEYIPQNEDELELKLGEVLDITEEVEEGWWSGTINGRSGLFPSNFVKELDLSDDGESQESSEDPEPATATVASPASPLLSPAINSEVPPLSVAQPKKIMGVGFGDIFKEGSVRLKTRIPNSETDVKKPEKPSPTPTPPIKVARTISSDLSRTETDSKPKAKETCRALYNYEATNDDELSFKEGDIIHLINKDSGDPGWWRGELNGREGVFPDNFAAIIQDSEKEKPKKPPPPAKSPVPKPELRLTEKRFTPPRPEEKDEKPSLEPKPSKPAAPQVPPKKPILVNKSNSIGKPASIPPKRPEKPAFSTPPSKPNGESPLSRPKSEPEPLIKTKMDLEQILSRPKSVEVEPSAVKSQREHTPSELSFDDVVTTSENLSHPTASRPKMPGKRPPGRFNGLHSKTKDLIEDQKVQHHHHLHEEEEESAKPLTPEVKKPSVTAAPMPVFSPISILSKPIVSPMSPVIVDVKPKLDDLDGKKSEIEELRAQMSELLTVVDALRKEHRNELDKIKKDLEEERMLRSSLESEIDKLKKAVQLS